MSELEPLAPQRATEMYFDARQDDTTRKTRTGQRSRLKAFCQWCRENDIENLNELSGRHLYEYRIWRREGHGEGRDSLKKISLRAQLSTLRAFLRFCAEIEAVPEDLYETVPLPVMVGGEDVSDSTLDPERTVAILEYLGQYHYASRDHVTWLLAWQTGCRLGGLQALDVDDVDLDGSHPRLSGPAVHFVHRPPATPLKNADKSTRWNRIPGHVATAIEDYLEGPRIDVVDDAGRAPLLTTEYGRPAATTIRSTFYRWTRPCHRGEPCPHERDLKECEATAKDHASKCPSARSPHDQRSGRVTYYAREDVPRRIVKDRLDASEDVLDKHYDRRSERERSEQRAQYLPDL